MEIKQLKLNGTAFYPKVGVDSIVNADGSASAVDTVVTENSTNLVTSGAVYDSIQLGGGSITVDSALSTTSTNPVQNKVITNSLNDAIQGKQDTLVSGTNIKTVNGNNLLGSGDITVAAQVKGLAYGDGSSYMPLAGSGNVRLSGDLIISSPAQNVLLMQLPPFKTVNGLSIAGTGDIDTSIDVDSSLSTSSENPVQNKVVTQSIEEVDTRVDNLEQNAIIGAASENEFISKVTKTESYYNEDMDEAVEVSEVPAYVKITLGMMYLDHNHPTGQSDGYRQLRTLSFQYSINSGSTSEWQSISSLFLQDVCTTWTCFNYSGAIQGPSSANIDLDVNPEGLGTANIHLNFVSGNASFTGGLGQIIWSSFKIELLDGDEQVVGRYTPFANTNPSGVLYKSIKIDEQSGETYTGRYADPNTFVFDGTTSLKYINGQGLMYNLADAKKFAYSNLGS